MDSSLSKKRKLKDVDVGDATAPVISKKPKDDETQPLSDDDGEGDSDLETGNAAAQDAPILPPAAESQAFEHLNLSEKTMKAIKDMEFTQMTEIQRRVRLDGSEADLTVRPLLTPDITGHTATSGGEGCARQSKDRLGEDISISYSGYVQTTPCWRPARAKACDPSTLVPFRPLIASVG